MSSISEPDHCAERPSLVLLSTHQEYLMTFKLMTSQVVQRARPLRTCICELGSQRVNGIFCENLGVKGLIFPRFLLFQCCIGVARSFTAIPNYCLKIPFTFVKMSLNSISFLAS